MGEESKSRKAKNYERSKKLMKKNKMMRLASVLLVAVLLSTSIISGTFAKYVTEGSASDQARVAKFGVVVSATGDLFSTTYKRVDDGNTPGTAETDHSLTTPNANGFSMTVESNEKVVAPGTKSTGTGLTFGVSGTPEVDVKVVLNFNAVKDVFLKKNAALPDMTKADYTGTFEVAEDEYHPIVFTLQGNYLKAANIGNIQGLDTSKKADEGKVSGTLAQIKAVFDALNGADGGIYVDANNDLATTIGSFNLTWEWIFEDTTTTGDDGAAKKLRDQKDTLLGDIAAGLVIDKTDTEATGKIQLPDGYTSANDSYSTQVSVALTVSVTQVD